MDTDRLNKNSRYRNLVWAVTVLLGAWLLFQVQPMAGKRILPWFGGGPAVWTTAMLFFQASLLAGYLYAHLSNRFLRPRMQAVLHVALLAAAVVVVGLEGAVAGEDWKPAGSAYPRLRIVGILSATIGLAYIMLAATAPLVQVWWGRHNARSPYRLYALSNFGSLARLISYPLLVEPYVGSSMQGTIWFGLFCVFAVLCGTSAWFAARTTGDLADDTRDAGRSNDLARIPVSVLNEHESEIAPFTKFLWLALPACASALLLAVTNFLCQDIASFPLLWVAPLAVYLVTFIVAFDADRWYVRSAWLIGAAITSFAACWSWRRGANASLSWQVGSHLALLFCVGMVCHGEVARLRPSQNQLTSYYLWIAIGGVVGGFFVAVIAPLLFSDYYELPLTVLAAWILSLVAVAASGSSALSKGGAVWVVLIALWGILAAMWVTPFVDARQPIVASARNFFGVLRVRERSVGGKAVYRQLFNGRISHGMQFMDDDRRRVATTYCSTSSGIGQLFALRAPSARKRVGVVGLGAGTLAAYAESGDAFRFYEINPQVSSLAERYFTYLTDARRRGAQIEIVEGDARLALELEASRQLNILVLDAFSSDAIPMHLLTQEAFSIYKRHLRPTGILAIHISNRHLDLARIVLSGATQFDFQARIVTSDPGSRGAIQQAVWAFLYPDSENSPLRSLGTELKADASQRPVRWTDDYSSILDILK